LPGDRILMTTPTAPAHAPQPIHSVGYIGLGIMGSAMAANLLKAGFKLTVWNRTPAKCEPLVDAGATQAASPAEMTAAKPEVICINVTDTPDVEAVLLGAQGVAAGLGSRAIAGTPPMGAPAALTGAATQALADKPPVAPLPGTGAGLIVIDHSTISPQATQRFAARLAERGVTLLDAPVSGGDVGARNATLSIMVGGPAEAFARCLPVLQAMGKTVTHVGPSGMGQVCKACNQVGVACTLMGVCEAIALARRSGLDPAKMIEVVCGGAGASWQLANLGPKVIAGDMAPGFMVDLMVKDLAIVTQAAKAYDLDARGVEAAQTYFQAVQAAGGGRLGTQAMSQAVEGIGKQLTVNS